MGKNFSCNNLGQRKKSDFYETPYSMTRQFLKARPWFHVNTILEPSAGDGAIVKVLQEEFVGVDIKAFDPQTVSGYDYLNYHPAHLFDLIITNPPFSLAEQFIKKSKELSSRFIALLLPLSYLHGKGRYDRVYNDLDFPLREVFVFTRYPMLGDPLREDGKYRTGMMVYAWYLWDREYEGKPCISWLDNNEYVLTRND